MCEFMICRQVARAEDEAQAYGAPNFTGLQEAARMFPIAFPYQSGAAGYVAGAVLVGIS
jgi:hypothetical protein